MFQRHIAVIVTIAMAQFSSSQMYGAMPELGQGFSPRYFFGSPPLERRQSGACAAGQHHCDDINFPSSCCPDDKYCYVNNQGQPLCCAVGSICDNPCPTSQYFCSPTTTISGKAITTSACCQRSCSINAYQCASSYGGACCSLGFSCAANSCVSTAVAPTTLVSIVPSGCTTGQFSCASSMGGGCCNNGATCTSSDNTLLCASGTSAPSALRTGPDGALISGITQTNADSGLSTGAKAGIGAGIAVVGCIVIAGLLWFCMRRRKAAREAQFDSQQSESVVGGRVMSEASRPAGRHHGMTDYFGPAPTAGPYTDNESPGSVPYRGVPLSPQGPGDIVPAVEIGHSREHSNVTSPGEFGHSRDHSNVTSPGEFNEQNRNYGKSVPETAEHRIELP